MCRLLAFTFPQQTKQDLKASCINSFRELARTGNVFATSLPGHTDGWGIAVYRGGEAYARVYKSLSSGADDRDFHVDTFLEEGIPESGIAHLRKKTVGDTTLANTHPFIHERYAFIHNGTIAKDGDVYSSLTDSCHGATDSERLFRKFLDIKNKGESSTLLAYMQMITETKKEYQDYSAINTILHDGEYIYTSRVINSNSRDHSQDVTENYYTLYIGRTACGGSIVSSEVLPYGEALDQKLIPNNSVAVISLVNGEVEYRNLT